LALVGEARSQRQGRKSSHRETAIFRAQQFIDGLIKLRSNERTEAIDNGKTPARWI
jgi:hypothetical protein